MFDGRAGNHETALVNSAVESQFGGSVRRLGKGPGAVFASVCYSEILHSAFDAIRYPASNKATEKD